MKPCSCYSTASRSSRPFATGSAAPCAERKQAPVGDAVHGVVVLGHDGAEAGQQLLVRPAVAAAEGRVHSVVLPAQVPVPRLLPVQLLVRVLRGADPVRVVPAVAGVRLDAQATWNASLIFETQVLVWEAINLSRRYINPAISHIAVQTGPVREHSFTLTGPSTAFDPA